MKAVFFFLASIIFSAQTFGQTHQPRTFLFVPGAWDGGWDYAELDSILRAGGDIVYRPTLTGLGERVHLSNAAVNLSTYVADVVNLIRFENLQNIILVGHSFGGMVISGVAEQVPERIGRLIYLDAMVPNDGESAKDVCGELWDKLMVSFIKDSVMLYPFGTTKTTYPTDVPQPIRTFTEPLKIGNPLVQEIPTAFIQMTTAGKSNPANDQMGKSRAEKRNWKIYTFEGGHYAMREQPENLVKKLEEVLTDGK
ncbi:alpha/beta hydrolase [Parapedobacter defluvii]|uniref:alpha/beta fold hydrolase n=1 Tax=Parapedobacter defluvii TaxID=2045106 RepID=UPI0026D54D8E